MASYDVPTLGGMSQAWVFRCCACRKKRVMESTIGRITIRQALLWVRAEKWSLKRDGWKCPECSQKQKEEDHGGEGKQGSATGCKVNQCL